MPNEQLRDAVDALRARLQQEIEVQLGSLGEHHERAMEAARRSAEADADVRWTAKVDAAKSEWATRLESELSATKAEADRRFATEVVRLKAAAEQAAVEAAARTRVQVERASAEAAAQARVDAEQAHAEIVAKMKADAEQASADMTAKMRAEAEQATALLTARLRVEAERTSAEAAARARAEAEQANAEVVANIRAEAEQASAQLTLRLRAEAEQAAAVAAVRVRDEADQELETERQRGMALLDSERERWSAEANTERQRVASVLDAERQRVESELQAERQRADADRLAERHRFDAERQQFRSERQRFEAERQQLMVERDRLLTEAQNRAPAPDRSAELEEKSQAVRRLESALETEQKQAQRLNEELRQTREAVNRAEAALEEERARAKETVAQVLSIVPESDPASLLVAHATERNAQLAMVDRLFGAMRSMDAAKSLTDVLTILVQSAAAEASRAAIFVSNGEHLQGHKSVGFSADIAAQRVPARGTSLFAKAVERREAVASSQEAGLEAPAFASLPAGRAAIAVPIAIGGEPVAVLYADDGGATDQIAPASWPEVVQMLGSHAASCLAHLTAARTAQAMRVGGNAASEDEGSAKRYARLLVSEIKLYNEAAVRVGRENRDLLNRLGPEIERARRLYEERVPASSGQQSSYFEQELIQTLANGDAALLGVRV
jgi:hypothetical protein